MHSRTVPRPAPAVAEDPFADLLDALDDEATLTARSDDGAALRDLFGTTPRRDVPSTTAPPGSPWPDHNFNAAYHSLRRSRPAPVAPRVLSESEVWDVDTITIEPPAEPVAVASTPAAWRAPQPAGDPAADWLHALAGDLAPALTTEARLIDIAHTGRPDRTLFEATELLTARPRRAARVPASRLSEPRVVPKTVEVAALAVLLLFALAVLQLLLS